MPATIELFGQLQGHPLGASEVTATNEVEHAHGDMMPRHDRSGLASFRRPYCRTMALQQTGTGG